MTDVLDFQCRCGTVKGLCRGFKPGAGIRAVCYCSDCQAFARFLGDDAGILDANGGTDIYQTSPSHLEIRQGREAIACVEVSAKGLKRWYAACCRTPLANTPPSRRLPFAGTIVANFDPDRRELRLGPVETRVFTKEATGILAPGRDKPLPLIVFGLARRASGQWIGGGWKRNPFFDAATGAPIASATRLTAAERAALDQRAYAGAKA